MKILLIALVSILLPGFAFSQRGKTKIVTGTILSGDSPIQGVSVYAINANRYVVTDKKGNFTFSSLPLPDTLLLTYVGYNTIRVTIDENTSFPLKVNLQNTSMQLDSVTVFNTGYQALSKERATGAFTRVDNKTLNLQVGPNILNRLESVTSSVAFNKKNNTAPSISVRGLSTINGPTSPLIILDNFPFEGDINTIDPDMIESVTVLKDATAASIWGTRAGNGVIVITTKKGRYNQPLTITVNSNVQVSDKPDLFYLHPVSSSDYIDMEKLLYAKGYYNYMLIDPTHPAVSPVITLFDRESKGIITPADAESQINSFRNIDIRDQFDRYVYTNPVNQQYSLNISGGNSQMAWSASGGIDKSSSALQSRYQRLNARLENTFTPLKNLKITGGIYLAGTTTTSGKEDYTSQTYLYPYSLLKDANGNDLPAAKDYPVSYTDTAGVGKLLEWNFYPLNNYKHTYRNTTLSNIIANVGLQYHLGYGFSFDFKYQYEGQQGETKNINDEQSYEARNVVNLFSQVDPNTGSINYIVPKGGILIMNTAQLKANSIREQLNYSRTWGKHELTALAGNENREVHNTGSTYTTFGYNSSNLTTGIVDLLDYFPVYTSGWYYSIPAAGNDFEDQLNRYVSFYGNAAYTYNSKYTFTASGRRDASNLFGINTNQKWTPLWSAGGSWNISKENFYTGKMLPFLKLRATYGYTGNADPNRSGVITVYYNPNSYTTGFSQARIRQYPNAYLKWEKVGIANIGIDFASKNNRITGSIDWYVKVGKDLFGAAPVDITDGLGSNGLTKNVASMKSHGADIVINTKNTKGKFQWNTGLIFNYNVDKVTRAYLANSNAVKFLNNGDGITQMEGKPVHSVITYKWGGLEHITGNPQGYLDGALSTDYAAITGPGTSVNDLLYNGHALPTVFGSLTNSFRWRELEMTVNISYKFCYFFLRQPLNYSNLVSGADKKSTSDFAARWQVPGDESRTDVPSFQYPVNGTRDVFYANSSSLVEKGDHIRLQFITLSYTIGKKRKENHAANNIELYANATNLGILWRANKRGLDSDYSATTIPPSKACALGVRIFLQ